jgi:class 3 adenylate cyclase
MIGDQVNLASRLQELTRSFQIPIVLSESTASALTTMPAPSAKHSVDARVQDITLMRLRIVNVKGRQEPVAVYTVASECGTSADLATAG